MPDHRQSSRRHPHWTKICYSDRLTTSLTRPVPGQYMPGRSTTARQPTWIRKSGRSTWFVIEQCARPPRQARFDLQQKPGGYRPIHGNSPGALGVPPSEVMQSLNGHVEHSLGPEPAPPARGGEKAARRRWRAPIVCGHPTRLAARSVPHSDSFELALTTSHVDDLIWCPPWPSGPQGGIFDAATRARPAPHNPSRPDRRHAARQSEAT